MFDENSPGELLQAEPEHIRSNSLYIDLEEKRDLVCDRDSNTRDLKKKADIVAR